MSRSSTAYISRDALVHNLKRLRSFAPNAKVWSVIKANAYGHGEVQVAQTLAPHTHGFALAHFEEADRLRTAGIAAPILLMEGVQHLDQLKASAAMGFQLVMHSETQLEQLHRYLSVYKNQGLQNKALENQDDESQDDENKGDENQALKIWLKMDSGMHRLGLDPAEVSEAYKRLSQDQHVNQDKQLRLEGVMTHFACADTGHALNSTQLACFDQYKPTLKDGQSACQESIANSALIVSNPDTHRDWIRPGIALYGSSPLADTSADALGLKPVMRLVSRVIAIKQLAPGDTVGYGATWAADKPQRMAVVGVGYGDGYPRHVDGAQVSIGGRLCALVGRVSMDMITVAIPDDLPVQVGDEVECWGQEISVDTLAKQAGTISYELLCQVTARVPRVYE